MVNTAIVITLIVCGTLIILSIIQNVSAAMSRRRIQKNLDNFKKAFPRHLETPEKTNNDDIKFGGF